jgi:hypothetical protein
VGGGLRGKVLVDLDERWLLAWGVEWLLVWDVKRLLAWDVKCV